MRHSLLNFYALPLWLSSVVAAIAGIFIGLAFPAAGIWPLTFIGLFLFLWALVGRSLWSGLLIGLIGGAFFWGPLIFWLTLYLGPLPWIGLAGLQTFYVGLSGALIATSLTVIPRVITRTGLRIVAASSVVAGLWVAREAIAAVWPYGGFAWARIAQSQSESPFGFLVAWIGTAGLSFAIVWIATFALEAWRTKTFYRNGLVAALVLIVLAAVPHFEVKSSGTLRVAAVQGNTKSGLFDRVEPGQNVLDHTEATLTFVREPVDLVVWPENAADVDPLRDDGSAQILNTLSQKYDAPFLVGTITNPLDGVYFNSSLVWQHGRGVIAQYDKIHPVPFAEYMPERDFFHALAPDLVDMVWRDYSFGTRSNVVDIANVPIALSICFDIVDDQQIYELADRGAQLIIAQTNNADFGHSAESVQQLAIAKMRALETGRTVVNISTVGVSSIIRADGTTQASLPSHTRGAMTENVSLSTTITPAMVVGRPFEILVSALGLLGLAGARFMFIRSRPNLAARTSLIAKSGRRRHSDH